MSKTPQERAYHSPLEKHPKYVRAIGMISIENASLEVMLGDLLGALLGIHLEISQIIYFTSKAAIARVELLENIASPSIGDHPKLLERLRSAIKRAKAVMGKRHVVMHALWTVNEYGNTEVARISFPLGVEDVQLSSLTDLVSDFRRLIDDLAPPIDDVQAARGFAWKKPALG